MRRVVGIIAAPESGRVFVHCKDGVDRTGTVVALHRIIHEGWKTDDALVEAERRGMRRIQYWMRDYVEDYGRRLREPGVDGAAQHRGAGEDLGRPGDVDLLVTSPGWRPDQPLLVAAAGAVALARPFVQEPVLIIFT